ncbi:GumC family protein [Limnobacter sp.]|uniref:GumC family protein n=1 Tax=Limnobacter sp. TaxID=2003368 RepID=UPI002FE292EF
MNLEQLLLIFKARIRVILLTFCIVVTGALVTSFLLPDEYKADATLVVDVRSPDAGLANAGLPFTSPAFMNTQAELAASGRVIEQTISLLDLQNNETLRAEWEIIGENRPDFGLWLAAHVKNSVKVSPGKESNSLNITALSNEPQLAADLANGIAQAYINTSSDMSTAPAKAYTKMYEEQLQEAREELIEAQTKLSEFQKERAIVIATDDQIDVENARLAELSSALTQAQNKRAEQAGRASSSGEQGLLQDLGSNTVLNTMRTQLQQKQSTLAEASSRIGSNHPEYIRLKAEVDALQSSVDTEIRRSNATLQASARASAAQEASIRNALETQRATILKLAENRDLAATLQRDLEAAKKQFELLASRTSMSEISSKQTAANTFLVSEASVPTRPRAPGMLIIGISASLFGLLLGLALAFAMEFLDHRVRSASDLRSMGIPALAKISTSRANRGMRQLNYTQR